MFCGTSPEVITPSKLLRKISPVPKIKRRKLTARRQLASVLTEAANIEESRKKQRGSEVKEQRKRAKVNITNTSGLQSGKTLKKKKSKEKESSNQKTPENSDTNKCCECWENYFRTTKEDDWIECVCCINWLHESCSQYKDKCVDCGRKLLREENSKNQKRI
jgi:uncharacterized membrane protein YcgQ (UPF0703/DUF1980 family)